jgi:P-type conjugative transfer protein TrbJ
MQMQANIRGLTMEYQKVEAAWDTLYRDFGSFNGMSGKGYAAQAQSVLNQTNNATYDAMRAQGLVSQLGNDARNLESLLNASNTSAGAPAAVQAGNAIATVNTQQLMRLQQIVATSYRAQSSYHAQQANKEAMSQADSKRFFGDKIEKPGEGKGRGTKHY